jgi:Fe-S-cluster-containing dehydrogenase component
MVDRELRMDDRSKTLFIDYSKCIGCETCESVCRFVNETPRIHMTRTCDGIMAPLYCRHCEDPKCVQVCSRAALARDRDGAVVLQPMLCRGCETKSCVLACPFGAMFVTHTGVGLRKCDLCAGRRALGLTPACVEMCPCAAIVYVERGMIESLTTKESQEALERVITHIRPKS